jgi:hypothetical protein
MVSELNNYTCKGLSKKLLFFHEAFSESTPHLPLFFYQQNAAEEYHLSN